MQEYLPFPVLCWISLEFDLRIQCFNKVMLKINELKMPFILIWKSSRFWNVRISVEYFIFLSALLVTTSFQFSLFLTFFYLHSGGLILSIRNPDCSVISKKYCSDRSELSFSKSFFFFLSFLSLLLPHFDSSQFCSLFCACALSCQSGLYCFHLLQLPSPSPHIFFSLHCICFLFHFFPDALSSFQLFFLSCCLHCSCWPHPSANPLKSVSYMDESVSPPEGAFCVGESAGQEGSSGSYAFRTSEHRGFKGPDNAWTAIAWWAVLSCFSVTNFHKLWLLWIYPLFKKFLPPFHCSQMFPTYVNMSQKLFCCLLQVTGQTTLVGSNED